MGADEALGAPHTCVDVNSASTSNHHTGFSALTYGQRRGRSLVGSSTEEESRATTERNNQEKQSRGANERYDLFFDKRMCSIERMFRGVALPASLRTCDTNERKRGFHYSNDLPRYACALFTCKWAPSKEVATRFTLPSHNPLRHACFKQIARRTPRTSTKKRSDVSGNTVDPKPESNYSI